MRRRVIVAAFGVGLLVAAGLVARFGNDVARRFESDADSRSHGTPADGRLEHGKRLPTAGANFTAYSWLGATLGRNAVHGTVRDVLLDAFAAVAVTHPDVTFVYGETGWPGGGPFPPHKTHRNGTSVDLFVPVRRDGAPAVLPTWPHNRWGYDVELDDHGIGGGLTIDWDALAALLLAIDAAAAQNGAAIRLVIFEVPLQRRLFAETKRRGLRNLPWSTKPAWVRHDEHVHVDFTLGAR